MSTTTTNYKLIKPELTDPADITELNQNWDLIDAELKNKYGVDNKPTAEDVGAMPKNSIFLAGNADLNNIKEEGEYVYSWYNETIANTPVHSAFHLSVKKNVDGGCVQTYTSYTGDTPSIYYRQYNAAGKLWSDWKRIATTDYAVNKAGDTMTGNLIFAPTGNSRLGIRADTNGATFEVYSNWNKRRFISIPSDKMKTDNPYYDKLQYVDMDIDGNGTVGRYNIYHEGNKPTAADIDAAPASHDHDYLPLAGGNMTGQGFYLNNKTGRIVNNANGMWLRTASSDVDNNTDSRHLKIWNATYMADLAKALCMYDTTTGKDYNLYGEHNITKGTSALTAGSSALGNGCIYLQYE